MSSDDYQKITEILDRIGQGRNYTATAALFPLFYRELRSLALRRKKVHGGKEAHAHCETAKHLCMAQHPDSLPPGM